MNTTPVWCTTSTLRTCYSRCVNTCIGVGVVTLDLPCKYNTFIKNYYSDLAYRYYTSIKNSSSDLDFRYYTSLQKKKSSKKLTDIAHFQKRKTQIFRESRRKIIFKHLNDLRTWIYYITCFNCIQDVQIGVMQFNAAGYHRANFPCIVQIYVFERNKHFNLTM